MRVVIQKSALQAEGRGFDSLCSHKKRFVIRVSFFVVLQQVDIPVLNQIQSTTIHTSKRLKKNLVEKNNITIFAAHLWIFEFIMGANYY